MNAAIGNDVSKPWLTARFDRYCFQRSFWLGACALLSILAFAAPADMSFVSDASAKAKPHKSKPAKRSAARKVAPKTKVAITSPAALPMPAAIAQPQPAPHPLKVLSRDEILASDAGRLARIGRHIIAGYHDFSAIKTLVERQAITGIFITDHNVRGRTAAEIKSSIDQYISVNTVQIYKVNLSFPCCRSAHHGISKFSKRLFIARVIRKENVVAAKIKPVNFIT